MVDSATYLRGYGWRPQKPDMRDIPFTRTVTDRPSSVDLRPQMPPVYDQGMLGSCTANAIGAAMEYERDRQGETDFMPSRLFIYYNERAREGTVGSDSGAQIRDGIKVVNREGVCPEALWPYDTALFAQKPPRRCYVNAKTDIAIRYESIASMGELRNALASRLAVVFGFTVYQSFESPEVAKNGEVPMPGPNERVVGGHAVLAVGYDDGASTLLVRNSWGPSWGIAGYFHMPYAYLAGPAGGTQDSARVDGAYLASDLWAIQVVS
ncbi:C1A family cysteine protease [Nocardia sp. GAS34]|uniref:C1 family peptidase n=1 Tax=unclassified Nocardia TaxID=2637762 RepID=UPI003D247299